MSESLECCGGKYGKERRIKIAGMRGSKLEAWLQFFTGASGKVNIITET